MDKKKVDVARLQRVLVIAHLSCTICQSFPPFSYFSFSLFFFCYFFNQKAREISWKNL